MARQTANEARKELLAAIDYLLTECPTKDNLSSAQNFVKFAEEKYQLNVDRRRPNIIFEDLYNITLANKTLKIKIEKVQLPKECKYWAYREGLSQDEINQIESSIVNNGKLSKSKAEKLLNRLYEEEIGDFDSEKRIERAFRKERNSKRVNSLMAALTERVETVAGSLEQYITFRLHTNEAVITSNKLVQLESKTDYKAFVHSLKDYKGITYAILYLWNFEKEGCKSMRLAAAVPVDFISRCMVCDVNKDGYNNVVKAIKETKYGLDLKTKDKGIESFISHTFKKDILLREFKIVYYPLKDSKNILNLINMSALKEFGTANVTHYHRIIDKVHSGKTYKIDTFEWVIKTSSDAFEYWYMSNQLFLYLVLIQSPTYLGRYLYKKIIRQAHLLYNSIEELSDVMLVKISNKTELIKKLDFSIEGNICRRKESDRRSQLRIELHNDGSLEVK